jgi:hypothetical protein
MVIVKLMGGLGNQLFQYAAARRIAFINNVPLKLDISGFEVYKLHKYSLRAFNIQEMFASAEEINALKHEEQGLIKVLLTKTKKGRHSLDVPYVKEKHFQFDPDILKLKAPVYLDGYWQSEKYFKDIEDIIRREFTVKARSDEKNEKMAGEIAAASAVSLHIRRMDYITDKNTNQILGTCSMDYYSRAIEKILKKVANPHFFVFSDDAEWIMENMKIDALSTFVIHNGPDKNYEDLRLMSLCKHNVIANSTFSWWGSWLNSNPEKIVYCPSQWFKAKELNKNDLIPPAWESIA